MSDEVVTAEQLFQTLELTLTDGPKELAAKEAEFRPL